MGIFRSDFGFGELLRRHQAVRETRSSINCCTAPFVYKQMPNTTAAGNRKKVALAWMTQDDTSAGIEHPT
jgi:hypothetical protein